MPRSAFTTYGRDDHSLVPHYSTVRATISRWGASTTHSQKTLPNDPLTTALHPSGGRELLLSRYTDTSVGAIPLLPATTLLCYSVGKVRCGSGGAVSDGRFKGLKPWTATI